MKKKLLSITICTFAIAAALCFAGCSSQEPEEPANLNGEWTQTNSASEDSYQQATITDDAIEVYWVSDGGNTKSLYWSGTYTAPTEPGDYNWTSENDKSKTDTALLASGNDTKDFSYSSSDNKISYQVSALGTTTTVELEPTDK